MLWPIFFGLLVCVVVWRLIKQEPNDLAHLPGPPRTPIFGSVFMFLGKSHSELFKMLVELPKKYGNRLVIKAMHRYILHVYKVEDIEIVLTHSRNIKKNKPYTFIEPWLGTGLLISNGSKWQKRRKILTPTFHFDILKGFVKVFEEQSRNLTTMLRKKLQESNVVDTMAIMSDFTLYIICETAMGIRLNADKSAEKMMYKKAIMEIGQIVMKRLTTVWLHSDLIFYNMPIGKKFTKCLENVHSFADNVILERKKKYESVANEDGGRRRLAFLDLLLEAERNGEIDLEGVREEGHDTTATALAFGLVLLADSEEVQTAMGIRLNADKSAEKMMYKKAIMDIGQIVMKRLTTVWLHSDLIFYNMPIGKKFTKCLENVHSFADNVILERKKKYESVANEDGGRRRLAFLDLLLEAERNGEIDLEGVREEVNTFMFEGHDTTATALAFGLVLLADSEEVQERLFEECQRVGPEPSVSELNDMKYLEAVVKEILRLYPSVPFIGREITEDFMLDDIKVKKGCEVVVHIYDVHRRPDLYPDPVAFKPERFLDEEKRHPYSYVPFSAGPRNCIGQKFAKLQMKVVISEIVRNFKLSPLVAGARPDLKVDLVLRPAETIYVKFYPR
ncbi:cytochrome p450 CYP4S1 [Danaus plexippus plexippus]|uniref:Cytochrome p450 CYP4S1 n=1 Tax=Danaus plexippus plexippus TaxID=278856 RepID=A0A212ET62_DANPL|nr:cytochrome p450 CYP4S1 [Danaus plexippus plexippus]